MLAVEQGFCPFLPSKLELGKCTQWRPVLWPDMQKYLCCIHQFPVFNFTLPPSKCLMCSLMICDFSTKPSSICQCLGGKKKSVAKTFQHVVRSSVFLANCVMFTHSKSLSTVKNNLSYKVLF